MNERQALLSRFSDRLVLDTFLSRQLVSYQGNRLVPGLRWLKYREGFSAELVRSLIAETDARSLLDPFAGMGTAPLVAAQQGLDSLGVELMPVGVLAARSIAEALRGLDLRATQLAFRFFLRWLDANHVTQVFDFPHVPITASAFPAQTERFLSLAREAVYVLPPPAQLLLNTACMGALEELSYTSKDGAYLRWDARSDHTGTMNKGRLPSMPALLRIRLNEMLEDIPRIRADGHAKFVQASSLEYLPSMPDNSADLIITSPPYVNRYDYTRIYALELVWLGYTEEDIGALRQQLLTSTVENRLKDLDPGIRSAAADEVLDVLEAKRGELNNPNIIRMIAGYFKEMAFILRELRRIVRPGGYVYMVNDNVQHHGEDVPVDLILSDLAEQVGFRCVQIRVLPRGKGNSSQQMGRYGRRELRKCVYVWQCR